MVDNEDRTEFLEEKEKLYSGKVHFLEFARLWGTENTQLKLPLNGLLYLAGSTLVFEDFEKEDSIFGFALTTGKKKKKYEKTHFEIPQKTIRTSCRISEKNAEFILARKAVFNEKMIFKPRWYKFLINAVQYFELENGKYLILEILNWKKIEPYLK